MLKALLFDLDGTLSNTDAVHFSTWIEVLRPYGIEVTRELYEERLSGRMDEDGVRDLLPDLSEEETDRLLEFEELRARQRASELGPLPGLRGLLEQGRRREVSLALVTNSTDEDAGEVLQPLGLNGAFDPIIYPKDTDEDKPAAVPYEEALERLGVSPEEAVAFEDSVTGAKAAVAAGITTVGIASSNTPEELLDAGVELVVGDFMDPALHDLLGWR
ncbi:MAG: HAD family phosphatase [Actinomycetota bacterium]|nr:HAD family phosphatase [Actinomycetota bacterium]